MKFFYQFIKRNYKDFTFYKTLLHMAVENVQPDLVRLLINMPNINVNIPYKLSSTEQMKEFGYENKITCEKTALYIAAEKGDFQSVTYLLCDERINVNAKSKFFYSENNKVYEKTALHIAVEKGYLRIIISLINHKNIDITVKDQDGKVAADLTSSEKIKKILGYQ